MCPHGLHQSLYVRFLMLQESYPQTVLAKSFVAGNWIVCSKSKCLGIPWISCQVKWKSTEIEHPRNNAIDSIHCLFIEWLIHGVDPLQFFDSLEPLSLPPTALDDKGKITFLGIESINFNSAYPISFMYLMLRSLTIAHIFIHYQLMRMRWALTLKYNPLNISRQ